MLSISPAEAGLCYAGYFAVGVYSMSAKTITLYSHRLTKNPLSAKTNDSSQVAKET